MNEVRTEETSPDYWTVYAGDREIGTVVGGGPTAATRYKAVTAGNVAVNPDDAPGSYWPSLDAAAGALR